MNLQGKAIKYGNDVDTDVIIPARYLNNADPTELAKHCMEDLDPEFINRVHPGDIMVAGKNFGCGSSREHAPIAIKAAGISAVVAQSFARIFYRNALNIGLPILESPEASAAIADGDEIAVDISTGKIKNLSNGQEYTAKPFPPFMQDLINQGGLVEYVKARLKK